LKTEFVTCFITSLMNKQKKLAGLR